MKYHILFLLSSILLLSCKKSNKKAIAKQVKEEDTLIYSVSAKSFDNNYRADYRSNMLYVINKNDTLIARKEEGISPIPLKFVDYNNDGFLDIRYGYNSNYFFEMIMLFDNDNEQFRKIDGIDNPEYANSNNIINTELYYSFSPNGCEKNNWVSYLFSIKDYKVEPKGLIEYKQCIDDQKGMYVFKIINQKKVLIEKINLKEADKKKLENHWKDNLKKIASL